MRKISGKTIATLSPSLLAVTALTGFTDDTPSRSGQQPNILLIMVDQMQTPPEGYGSDEGATQGLKEIIGFRPMSQGNLYKKYFPGLLRLRENAVVMKKHYTASAASVPSRSCIMTGQYFNTTGVTSTDGMFKSASDVPFLDPNGTPTIGDWFRAAGYSTHYFGKWHVSEAAPPDYLEPWGFDNWESSYPEPHGGTAKNLGVYRDVVFGDNIVDFLKQQATNPPNQPWITVASFVDPHDVSYWPVNWQVPDTLGVFPWQDYPPPLLIPQAGDTSLWGTVNYIKNGDSISTTFRVPLNPDGFPQENSHLPPTFSESLNGKPLCQYDYSLKYGLGNGAVIDYNYMQMGDTIHRAPLPFQLQGSWYQEWTLNYLRFYFYCHYMADRQIRRVLNALDENKLTENTIVIFLSDHGEMAGAHGGMIQKWHSAYEEITRVPMVISSPLVNSSRDTIREITQPTSSIDLLPTLLGLAGIKAENVKSKLPGQHAAVSSGNFPGADLSSYIRGINTGPIIGPDGNPRSGVLYRTSDMITELGSDSHQPQYNLFLQRVDSTIGLGYPLAQGTVRQPNNVNAFCTGDWKIVQYTDPKGTETDQWELYCLTNDPIEMINLVDYTSGNIRPDVSVPGMTTEELILKNQELRRQLGHSLGIAQIAPRYDQPFLAQNMPNPFFDRTHIRFHIPEAGRVRLSVCDLSGRELSCLQNQEMAQGDHSLIFNAGSTPSGVYFLRLEFNHQQALRKMILMK